MVTTAPNRERKTTIIIGASRGLGLGLAREFARRGWQVTATARNASSAKELAATFAASDEKIAVEQVDIDLPDRIAALASRLALCRFDLIFINAGVAGPEHQSVDAVTPEEIGALIYTNAADPDRTPAASAPERRRHDCLHVSIFACFKSIVATSKMSLASRSKNWRLLLDIKVRFYYQLLEAAPGRQIFVTLSVCLEMVEWPGSV